MGKAWKQWSEDELASEAQRGWGQGATIEAMHRLRESLNRLRVSNDRSSRLIFALTIVLIINQSISSCTFLLTGRMSSDSEGR